MSMNGLITYDFSVLNPDAVFCESEVNAENRLNVLTFNLFFFYWLSSVFFTHGISGIHS